MGKGYATEAVLAIKHTFAQQTTIHTFSALAVEDNITSIRVMKNIGMKFIKKYDHQDPLGDFIAVHYQIPVK